MHRLMPGVTIRGLVSFGFGLRAPGRSRTCVPGFGRRRRIRWTTGACGGCRIRTCAALSRRLPFSRRLPCRARPILQAGVSPSDTPTSARARTRTWGLRIRSAALCPTELHGRGEDVGTPPPALGLATSFGDGDELWRKSICLLRLAPKWAASSAGGGNRTPGDGFGGRADCLARQ